jgi:hypothetical protein
VRNVGSICTGRSRGSRNHPAIAKCQASWSQSQAAERQELFRLPLRNDRLGLGRPYWRFGSHRLRWQLGLGNIIVDECWSSTMCTWMSSNKQGIIAVQYNTRETLAVTATAWKKRKSRASQRILLEVFKHFHVLFQIVS